MFSNHSVKNLSNYSFAKFYETEAGVYLFKSPLLLTCLEQLKSKIKQKSYSSHIASSHASFVGNGINED